MRVAAGICCGAGAWCSVGVFALVPRGSEFSVVGLLPPVWLLAGLAAAGAAVALIAPRLPTGLLLLPVVAIAPWLSPPWPALLVWSGAALLVLWAIVITGVAYALGPGSRLAVPASGRRASVTAAFAAAAVMALFAWATRAVGPTGDEPHYLLMATSVLRDGDLDLANDYTEERQMDFYPGPLSPRHVVLSTNGREYSFHGLGVAALALPGFSVGGVPLTRVTFIAISAIGVGLLFAASRAASSASRSSEAGARVAAAVAVAATGAATPFVAQSAALYPDGPAAAVVSLALLTCVRLERKCSVPTTLLAATGVALAFLPWLHLRHGSLSLAFGLAVLWLIRQRGDRNREDRYSDALVFLAAPLISATLLFASSWVMFETLDPTAAFRQKARGSLAAAPIGMFGLLADHEYGLLAYAPAFGAAILGAAAFVRQTPTTAIAGFTASAATLMTGASFVWWGGTTSPARFLVPVLPVLTLSVACWWTGARALWRASLLCAIAIGAALTFCVAVAEGGRYVVNAPDGRQSIFEWANGVIDLPAALPSLFRTDARLAEEATIAAVWLITAACLGALLTLLPQGRQATGSLAAWGAVLSITVAAPLAWHVRGFDPRQPDRSQLQLLEAAPRALLTTGFDGWEGLTTTTAVLGQLRPKANPRESSVAPGGGHVVFLAPRVPAGRYRVLVESAPSLEATRLSLEVGRDAWPLHTWTAGEPAPQFTLALPVHSVRVLASPGASARPVVRLQPEVVTRGASLPVAQHVTRYGALDVYTLDAAPVMETGGFWLPSSRRTAVFITNHSGEAPPVHMTVEAAEAVRVVVARGSWTQGEPMETGARVTFSVPASDSPAPLYLDVAGSGAQQAVWVTVAAR